MELNRKFFALVACLFCGLCGNAFAHEHTESEDMQDHDHSTCGCHRMTQDESPAPDVAAEEKMENQDKSS